MHKTEGNGGHLPQIQTWSWWSMMGPEKGRSSALRQLQMTRTMTSFWSLLLGR